MGKKKIYYSLTKKTRVEIKEKLTSGRLSVGEIRDSIYKGVLSRCMNKKNAFIRTKINDKIYFNYQYNFLNNEELTDNEAELLMYCDYYENGKIEDDYHNKICSILYKEKLWIEN